MPKRLLHFDTINAQYVYDSTNNAYSAAYHPSPLGWPDNYTNCFEVKFSLPQAIHKVKKLSLKSVEIPVAFDNIRASHSFIFTLDNNPKQYLVTFDNVTITDGASLCTLLNTLVTATTPLYGLAFSYNSSTNLLTFAGTTAPTNLTIVDTPFSRAYLGFRGTTDTYVPAIKGIAASCCLNLNPDNYLNIYFPNVPAPNNNVNGVLSTFKVALNAASQNIYFWSELMNHEQSVHLSDNTFTFSQLHVVVYDRWGNNIWPRGGDWSFTMEVSYDD